MKKTIQVLSMLGKSILMFLIVLVMNPLAYGKDGVVCREHGVQGMAEFGAHARYFLPKVTSQQDKAAVYIARSSTGEFYYHSNFVTSGYEYPTKVAGDPKENKAFANIETIFPNIIYDRPPTDLQRSQTIDILNNEVDIFLDISMFDANGIPLIDLSKIKNIKVVDGDKGVILTRQSEILNTAKPPPSLISKIKGCCFFARPPYNAELYKKLLEQRKFDPSNLRVASLFIDSGTESAFQNSKVLKNLRVSNDSKSIKSVKDIESIFIKSKGKTLILLGHIEGSDYVINNSANREQFRISIDNLRKLAARESVSLIDIGCETTKAIKNELLSIGILTKYNSVDAVNAIDLSVRESKTYADLLEKISSNNLKIVVDQYFVNNNSSMIRSTIYSRIKNKGKDVWVKIANITFSFFGK
jgi:hypothetical protein